MPSLQIYKDQLKTLGYKKIILLQTDMLCHQCMFITFLTAFKQLYCWGCRILQLHLCRGVRPTPNECPDIDTKQSDGEVPVMFDLWGIRSTPSLPLFPGLHWPGGIATDRALFMGQIEINCVLMLNWITWLYVFFIWIELPRQENPANTCAWHTETLDICFELIRSHQQRIPWSP